MELLGIDIGGSGIKGALVNTETGEFTVERFRVPTPQPSVPEAVADAVAEVVNHFGYKGAVGCTFPSVVRHGVMYSAANVDPSWIGFNGQALFEEKTGCPFIVLNDADAAGIAEMTFGAGVGHPGMVIVLTFGTGIGSSFFIDGTLVPNTELGHLEIRGKIAEARASDRIRREKDYDWEKWSEKVQEFLERVEFLFSPDLIIFGGGISKKHEKFFPFLKTQAKLLPAALFNDAGIVGAALAARVKA